MSESLPLAPHPSRKSLKRLDWFVFLVADVQTGFGPFVAVYLTSQKWTQIEIGLGEMQLVDRRPVVQELQVLGRELEHTV